MASRGKQDDPVLVSSNHEGCQSTVTAKILLQEAQDGKQRRGAAGNVHLLFEFGFWDGKGRVL